jgi:hypothetical protein
MFAFFIRYMKRLLILSTILIIILYITVGGYSVSKPVSAYHSWTYDWQCENTHTGKTWICGTSYCDMHSAGDVQKCFKDVMRPTKDLLFAILII